MIRIDEVMPTVQLIYGKHFHYTPIDWLGSTSPKLFCVEWDIKP